MNTEKFNGKSVENQARRYCSEDISLIENYEQAKADHFQGWCVHHRLEYLPCQKRWVSYKELFEKGLYFNRPAWELLFMKRGEHVRFHNQDPHSKEKRAESIRNSEKVKENINKINKVCIKPFEIDGIRFEKQVDAAKYFNISQPIISNWLNGKIKTRHICKFI